MQRIKVRISRLRDIGWTEWDPIGLRRPDGWEGDPAADEYDGYLLRAAGILINGGATGEAIDHLIWGEAENMGLGVTATTRARAARTIDVIRAYVDELRSVGLGS
jgi:hypothetical protein